MIRSTEKMNPVVPDNYEAKDVLAEDRYEIADVILAAYKANPAFKSV